jgi:CxxC motif-containing protein
MSTAHEPAARENMAHEAPMTDTRAISVDMVCIACPMACRLTVTTSAADAISVVGNRCPRGEAYGSEEVRAPKRILTAVVPTDSAQFPFAPVRTDRAISRGLVKRLLSELYRRRISLPVRQGYVLVDDFDGARVIVTRTLPPDEIPPVRQPGAKPEGQDEIPGLQ